MAGEQSAVSDAIPDIHLEAGTAKIATGKNLNAAAVIVAIGEEGYAVTSTEAA